MRNHLGKGLAIVGLLWLAGTGCGQQQQVRATRTARAQPPPGPVETLPRTTSPGEVAGAPAGTELGTQPGGPASEVPPGTSPWQTHMSTVDLSGHGLPLRIEAPEGATVRTEFGAVKVMYGPRFSVELYSQAADIGARKKEIENNAINRFRRFLIDTPDALLYEAAAFDTLGRSEYHFIANVAAGGKTWRCEDTKGISFSEAEARAMLDACRSVEGQ